MYRMASQLPMLPRHSHPQTSALCQYRERATCHCLWSGTFSHLCLWLDLHYSSQITNPSRRSSRRSFADAPVHLQWMLMCLQGYNCTISYHPGKEMLLADTLSKYASVAAEGIALDTAIHCVHIGTSCKASYQELTCTDPLPMHPC